MSAQGNPDIKLLERRSGAITYYQFHSLARRPDVRHAITSRLADLGDFPEGLNLSFHAGDAARVVDGRRRVCSALGLSFERLVVPKQVHGDRVTAVDATYAGRGANDPESALPETDAVVTDAPEVTLFVSAADCVPLLYFDPVHRAIGVAHSGWRGTVAGIAALTVQKMHSCYGTVPERLIVGIGPSIGPCCYVIGEEVADAAEATFKSLDGLLGRNASGEITLNLWAANKRLLVTEGVAAANIELPEVCTSCRNDVFFSHRAEQGRAGRFGALIALASARRQDGA